MCSSFLEDTFRRCAGSRTVDFPEEVEQQNVQHFSGAASLAGSRGGVQFLRDLLVRSQTSNRSRHGEIHFHQAWNCGHNNVDFRSAVRAAHTGHSDDDGDATADGAADGAAADDGDDDARRA
jgi:hypothetical protein